MVPSRSTIVHRPSSIDSSWSIVSGQRSSLGHPSPFLTLNGSRSTVNGQRSSLGHPPPFLTLNGSQSTVSGQRSFLGHTSPFLTLNGSRSSVSGQRSKSLGLFRLPDSPDSLSIQSVPLVLKQGKQKLSTFQTPLLTHCLCLPL